MKSLIFNFLFLCFDYCIAFHYEKVQNHSFEYLYDNNGHENGTWATDFSLECGSKKRQSPINIDDSKTVKTTMPPLKFENYDSTENEHLLENSDDFITLFKHVAKANDPEPLISGGNLNGKYVFYQLHFHWGTKSHEGTEHWINNKQYELEMHMVHLRKPFNPYSRSVDEIAVISVIFEQGNSTSLKGVHHLASLLSKIENSGDQHKVDVNEDLSLHNFIPKNLSQFYRYAGSLTTPPCNETVQWSVIKNRESISSEDLDLFRKLESAPGAAAYRNYRSTKDLNGRVVFDVTTNPKANELRESTAGAATLSIHSFASIVTVLLCA